MKDIFDSFTYQLPRIYRRIIEEHIDSLSEHFSEILPKRNIEKLRKLFTLETSKGQLIDGVILDPFTLYIPFHEGKENYGIYFRVNRILEDLKLFLGRFLVYSTCENILAHNWRDR